MIVGLLVVVLLVVWVIRRRRKRKQLLAGLIADRPTFNSAPPARRMSARKHEVL